MAVFVIGNAFEIVVLKRTKHKNLG
jgi:hypothetical protein